MPCWRGAGATPRVSTFPLNGQHPFDWHMAYGVLVTVKEHKAYCYSEMATVCLDPGNKASAFQELESRRPVLLWPLDGRNSSDGDHCRQVPGSLTGPKWTGGEKIEERGVSRKPWDRTTGPSQTEQLKVGWLRWKRLFPITQASHRGHDVSQQQACRMIKTAQMQETKGRANPGGSRPKEMMRKKGINLRTFQNCA